MLQSNEISGIIPDISDAYGIAFRDFNNDGNPDLYIVCFRNLNRLLINNGGLIPFIDRTISSGMGGFLMTHGYTNLELGAAAADYDNDGLADLFLAGWGKAHKLFHNTGNVTFEDATANLAVFGKLDANQGLWFDADNDGFLDLYITDEHQSNRLFHNNKNGHFREVVWTNSFADNAISEGALNADINFDGAQDLYVCNWFGPDYFLINNGKGQFDKINLNLTTLQDSVSTNSCAFADIDNDGDQDLFVAGNNGYVYYYENISTSDSTGYHVEFKERTDHPFYHIGSRVFGLLFEDFNLDGWLDCFITTFGANRLYLNDGTGHFVDNYDTDNRRIYSTGASAADLDHDGDLDIVVGNKTDLCQVYLNPSNASDFLVLKLRGVKSNRDAIGAKVWFTTGQDSLEHLIAYREIQANTGYLSSKDPTIHFGMGDYKTVNIRVLFPSGKEVIKRNLPAGKTYFVSEYSWPVVFYYSGIRILLYIINRSDFSLNFSLILLSILFIYFYFWAGKRRYSWSHLSIWLQFFIWMIIVIFLFIILRSLPVSFILIMTWSISTIAIVLSLLYSEHFLRLRRKHDTIRKILQSLSDQIINIHENDQLAEKIVNTVDTHPEISNTCFYLKKHDGVFESFVNTNGTRQKKMLQLQSQVLALMMKNKVITPAFYDFGNDIINTYIPIKRKNDILGLLAFNMKDPKNIINQEDLDRLTTIANQAAIAIENNNYIKETAGLIEQLTESKVREQYINQLEKTNQTLDEKNRELNRLFRELQDKEAQLIHSEKMASLGHLVAGISHELNNPISFIYSNMKVLSQYIDELKVLLPDIQDKNLVEKISDLLNELKDVVNDSANGSKSVKEIVKNLKSFSRIDQAEWKETQVGEIIDTCLMIIKPQIPPNINVNVDLQKTPKIMCNPGQLNQVVLNLITNAIQAIKHDNGNITIKSYSDDSDLFISVSDNGEGIPPEIVNKVFDPFFTTKPVNTGTGLGLSISYSIIEKHKGQLSFESNPGNGTTFTIKLPLNVE